jgi:hypothetical protein
VATGPTSSIFVDKKQIDGPNANERGKWWIPLVIVAQVSQKLFLRFALIFGHCFPAMFFVSFRNCTV